MNSDSIIINEDLKNIISDIDNIDKYKNKDILITGVNGIIGTYFCLVFLKINDMYDSNNKVFVLSRDRNSTLKRFASLGNRNDLFVIEGDLSSPGYIKLPDQNDIIIHAASQTSPWHFKNDPVGTLQVNSIGTNYLLEYAKKSKSECFLYLSTREIYGENYLDKKFADEQYFGPLDPTVLRSCYPESKKFGEMCCVAYKDQFNMNCKIARIAHTFGPSMKLDDGRIIGEFIYRVLNSEDIVLNTAGTALISLTYITDVISGIFKLIENNDVNISNIANDKEVMTVKEFASTIISFNNASKVRHRGKDDEVPLYLTKQPALLQSDLIRSIGWKIKTSVIDGLQRTLKYYQESDN